VTDRANSAISKTVDWVKGRGADIRKAATEGGRAGLSSG
jgi:hypothetical protein